MEKQLKAIVLGQRWNPHLTNKILGGAELIEDVQLRLLSENGHEVHFITNSNSDDNKYPGVVTHKTTPSKFSDEGIQLGKQLNSVRNAMITKIVAQVKPDIVLVHDDINPSIQNLFANKIDDVPVAFFVHAPPSRAGGIGIISYIDSMQHVVGSNGTIAAVSKTGWKEWNEQIVKSAKYLETSPTETSHVNDFLHTPSYWDKPKVSKNIGYGFMATRLVPEKKALVAAKYHKLAGMDFQLCVVKPNDETTEAYGKKVQELVGDNMHVDMPRYFVLDRFAHCDHIPVFGPESFPLMPIEGNLYGAQVWVINKNSGHPAIEACKVANSSVKSFEWIDGSMKEPEIIEAMKAIKPLSHEERAQLSEDTFEFFKPENAYQRLIEFIDRVIARKNSAKRGNILDFL